MLAVGILVIVRIVMMGTLVLWLSLFGRRFVVADDILVRLESVLDPEMPLSEHAVIEDAVTKIKQLTVKSNWLQDVVLKICEDLIDAEEQIETLKKELSLAQEIIKKQNLQHYLTRQRKQTNINTTTTTKLENTKKIFES
jgi:hypothetical protein